MTFYAWANNQTGKARIRIEGANINQYYCNGKYVLTIARENLDLIAATITKTAYHKVIFLYDAEDEDVLVMALGNFVDGGGKNTRYDIKLVKDRPDSGSELFQIDDAIHDEEVMAEVYPLQFTQSKDDFKRTFKDASAVSDQITIEKIGDYPMQIVAEKADGTLRSSSVYEDSEKIKLDWNPPLGDYSFRCILRSSSVKALANSTVTGDVRIYCRGAGEALFVSDSSEGPDDEPLRVYFTTTICDPPT